MYVCRHNNIILKFYVKLEIILKKKNLHKTIIQIKLSGLK